MRSGREVVETENRREISWIFFVWAAGAEEQLPRPI